MKQPTQSISSTQIPDYVTRVTDTLEAAGFEAFIVGGCVRDLLLSRKPKDWDVTTNATPEQIQALFDKTVYENKYGTVMVMIPVESAVTQQTTQNTVSRETNSSVTHETIEVTPYRLETTYSDSRHPDDVKFSNSIEDDLKRRDFTINAMAYSLSADEAGDSKGQLIDFYKGQEDLKVMSVKTVGSPDERFQEDALRLMRAIRFATELKFSVSHETMESIVRNAKLIENISSERIRDEFVKIIMSPSPAVGIDMLEKFGLLRYIIPELEEGIGCIQGGAHKYDVYEHLLHALQHASDKNWPLEIRLSALFHDIGKPKSRRTGTKKEFTFYGHEVIGARMTAKIMERLKFSRETSEYVTKMVRYHMFFSDPDQITLTAVRRTIVNVGREHIWELMQVRECDRVGMAKTEAPYRLRKYHSMIEEALRSPTSVGMLKIDGSRIMEILDEKPGPRVGMILNALLEEALENPDLNNEQHLEKRALELAGLELAELKLLAEKGRRAKDEAEQAEVEEIRKKHGVK